MVDEPSKMPVTKSPKPAAKAPGSASPFDHLRNEVDRLFEDFGRGGWRLPFPQGDFGFDFGWPRRAELKLAPAMDVVEKEHAYELTAELPGMDEKDIDIRLANGVLTISGEKTEEKHEEGKDKAYHVSERHYGSIQRSVSVPEGVDTSGIEASFAKGVLKVTMPKSQEARQAEKKIEVRAS